LQAYDFLHLNQKHGCILQFGGSDQWGNIVTGTELIRKVTGRPAFGITTPLITTASGAKMGKSQNGALWLNEDMISPYDYYQFWRNTDDRDVFKFMLIYTDIPVKQVKEYRTSSGNINDFKKLLAFEATKLCHGQAQAQAAADAAVKMFEQGDESANLPEFKLNASRVKIGVSVCEVLKEFGLVESLGEAKRLIKGNGIKLNRVVIADENLRLTESDFTTGHALLSVGKKKHIKIVLVA
jgi:tyrosyl-tRNA synthetase